MDFIPDFYTQTVKGEDKDLFRNAGTQMTSRALFPGSHYRMCSSKMRRKPRKTPVRGERRHGKHPDQIGAGLQKAPETIPPVWGGGGGEGGMELIYLGMWELLMGIK